jgi:hypothetical protein
MFDIIIRVVIAMLLTILSSLFLAPHILRNYGDTRASYLSYIALCFVIFGAACYILLQGQL